MRIDHFTTSNHHRYAEQIMQIEGDEIVFSLILIMLIMAQQLNKQVIKTLRAVQITIQKNLLYLRGLFIYRPIVNQKLTLFLDTTLFDGISNSVFCSLL